MAATEPRESRRDARVGRAPLAWWLTAFVVHRLALVFLAFDGVYFWEEAWRLLAAEALRSGWDLPLSELQADPYAGGSLVFSLLAVPVTALFGPSLAALKLVPLAWSAAGLWLWLLVTDRIAGRAAAHALGFLWLAAPPVFVAFNVIALGFHSDTVTLVGLQLLLTLRLVDEPASRARVVAWAATAGLAVWFCYTSAPPILLCAAWAAACGALPPARWPMAALGFAAGFSPWIVHSLASGGSLGIVASTFAGDASTSQGILARLWDVTVRGVPAALYFRNIGLPSAVKVTREWLAYPYLAIYATAFAAVVVEPLSRIALALRQRAVERLPAARSAVERSPELLVLAIFPLFLVVIAASNQEFNDLGRVRFFTFRVLTAALPSAFFAIALACSRPGRAAAWARRVVFGACALLALVGTGQLLNDGAALRPLREAEARETGAEVFGHLLVFRHGTDGPLRDRIDALPPELRASAWRGVGFSYAWVYATRLAGEPAAGLTRRLEAVEPEYRDDALDGARLAVGPGLVHVAPLEPSARRDEVVRAIEAAS